MPAVPSANRIVVERLVMISWAPFEEVVARLDSGQRPYPF